MQDGFIARVMRAISFLSRIPVPDRYFQHGGTDFIKSTRFFPLAGVVIAIPPACLAVILAYCNADALMTAAIVLGLATLITGALHEDGLADTADGFGGGATKERALEIMKDSRIGTYGSIALVCSFLIRAAAIAALVRELSPLGVGLHLISAAVMSRGLMVWHWSALPPARPDGVAATMGQPGKEEVQGAFGYGPALAILLVLPYNLSWSIFIIAALPFLATFVFNRICARKTNGHTGDTIGATQQITEMTMLVSLALIP